MHSIFMDYQNPANQIFVFEKCAQQLEGKYVALSMSNTDMLRTSKMKSANDTSFRAGKFIEALDAFSYTDENFMGETFCSLA